MKEFNLIVTGVGGQGAMTLGTIIAEAALKQGYDVRTTEVHGLAQRGGSIPIHIRFGEKLYTALVLESEADLIIALEPLEALRTTYFGSKKHKTVFLIDKYRLPPITVSVLGEKYPRMENIVSHIKPFADRIIIISASEIVKKETGSIITSNIFILGYAVSKGLLPLKEKFVLEAIEENVPKKYIELNKKVFEMGMKHK
ncbi:MAG: indolepyruvate ferredoxin oxidoreductase subunit beta [Candidatus Aenigmarchaeota archaeon]|nr:indolepyruvate ferredoxin oxidoreductase subunit beta [Candidatus Aenigmarchaeota archaeon]